MQNYMAVQIVQYMSHIYRWSSLEGCDNIPDIPTHTLTSGYGSIMPERNIWYNSLIYLVYFTEHNMYKLYNRKHKEQIKRWNATWIVREHNHGTSLMFLMFDIARLYNSNNNNIHTTNITVFFLIVQIKSLYHYARCIILHIYDDFNW